VNRYPFECPGELLRQADRVMRMAQPAFTATFHANGMAYRARWDYPGRLSVCDRNTGELVARSRLGRPTELAAAPRPLRVCAVDSRGTASRTR